MNKGTVTKVITGVAVAGLIAGGAFTWNGITQARQDAHRAEVHHALVVAQDRKTAHLLAADTTETRALMTSAADQSTYTTQQAQIAAEVAAQQAAAEAAAQAAAQKQAQLAAQQKQATTKTATKSTTRSTTTTRTQTTQEPVQPPAPVRCPAGSQAVSGDAGNDTSCLPSICFTIVLPDAGHPECDTPFKP